MRKLLQALAVAVIALMPVVFSSSASAADTCQLVNTGPGSVNTCTLTNTYKCEVTNDNVFKIINTNNQDAVTGTATNSGNTNGGSSVSGSATNSNGTTFNVTITNDSPNQICTLETITPEPETPVTPTAPVAPTTPGGQGAAVAAPEKKVAVLPNTSSDATATIIATSIAVLGAAAVIARLSVLAYSRLKS